MNQDKTVDPLRLRVISIEEEIGNINRAILNINTQMCVIPKVTPTLSQQINMREEKIKFSRTQNLIAEKVTLCRKIIFCIESIKLDYEREMLCVRQDGVGWSDYECARQDLEELESLIKEFHDEDD